MTRCCSCIKQQAAAIRHLKASGQPELMIDLTESIRKKQEAAAEMQQLLNRYFLGQRLIPVGPLSMNYAEFLGNLTMHQRLSQLLSAEKVGLHPLPHTIAAHFHRGKRILAVNEARVLCSFSVRARNCSKCEG